jgi:hypothetical protein
VAAGSLPDEAGEVDMLPGVVAEEGSLAVEGMMGRDCGKLVEFGREVA